jgi:hypothetical protein
MQNIEITKLIKNKFFILNNEIFHKNNYLTKLKINNYFEKLSFMIDKTLIDDQLELNFKFTKFSFDQSTTNQNMLRFKSVGNDWKQNFLSLTKQIKIELDKYLPTPHHFIDITNNVCAVRDLKELSLDQYLKNYRQSLNLIEDQYKKSITLVIENIVEVSNPNPNPSPS